MSIRLASFFCALIACCISTISVDADLTNVTDGVSTFQWDPDDGTNNLGGAGFDDDYAAGETVYLRYRQPDGLGGGNVITITMGDQTGINPVTNSATNNGATGSAHVDIGFFDGFSTLQILDVDFDFSITTGIYGNPVLNHSMTVTNTSANTITDMQLFNYWDWDLSTAGGAFNNQNRGVDHTLAGFTGFLQTNPVFGGPPPHSDAFRGTDDFDQWQVSPFGTIAGLINGGGNLNNSGTPFGFGDADGDDMEAAFGWNIGSLTPGSSFTVNQFVRTIPEPNSFLVLSSLFGLGATFVRRRRRK